MPRNAKLQFKAEFPIPKDTHEAAHVVAKVSDALINVLEEKGFDRSEVSEHLPPILRGDCGNNKA